MLLQLLFVASVVSSQWSFWPQWGPWQACYPEEPCDDCPCDYGYCHWWGDPHTETFDNMWHHFQGYPGRDYRYVTPCNSDFNLVPFQILTRHRACGWSGLTCSDYVDIRLYNPYGPSGSNFLATIRIDNGLSVQDITNGPFLPNGRYTIPLTWNIYVVVTRHNNWYVEVAVYTGLLCNYPDHIWRNLRPDFVVRANSWMGRVEVQLNEYYKNLVCGLCGFWSGTHHDEFTINGKYSQSGSLNCRHYDSSTPESMWFYDTQDWWHVNRFGSFWEDRGPYVRRLQEGQFENDADGIEIPQLNDPNCPDRVLPQCQSLFGEGADVTICVDELCGRLGIDCFDEIDCQRFAGDGFEFGDPRNPFAGQDPNEGNSDQTIRGAQ